MASGVTIRTLDGIVFKLSTQLCMNLGVFKQMFGIADTKSVDDRLVLCADEDDAPIDIQCDSDYLFIVLGYYLVYHIEKWCEPYASNLDTLQLSTSDAEVAAVLLNTSDYLEAEAMCSLCGALLADVVENSDVCEIRRIFRLPDDLSETDKFQTIKVNDWLWK